MAPSVRPRKKPVIIAAIMAALALSGCGGAGSGGGAASPASTGAATAPAAASTSASIGSVCVKPPLPTNDRCAYTSYPGIVGASSGPWVDENIWSGDKRYKQTLYSTSPGSWYVVANANTHFGGVLTYPNTGFYMTGAVGSYSTITSSFSTTIPHNARTAGWAAYDLWFNNWKAEVMIQTDIAANSYYDCTAKTSATIDGQMWHMCVFGAERVWKPGPNDQHLQDRTSGALNIQAFLTWMTQHGYLPTGSTWTAGSYGFEICDTGGTNEIFKVNSFSWVART